MSAVLATPLSVRLGDSVTAKLGEASSRVINGPNTAVFPGHMNHPHHESIEVSMRIEAQQKTKQVAHSMEPVIRAADAATKSQQIA